MKLAGEAGSDRKNTGVIIIPRGKNGQAYTRKMESFLGQKYNGSL